MANPAEPRNILVVRRDNIGDLICTTPLLRALRLTFPQAYIAALVNSYNAPVLERNDAIDEVFVYTKAKHATSPFAVLGAALKRLGLYRRLRKRDFDVAIAAGSGVASRAVRLGRIAGAKKVLGYLDPTAPGSAADFGPSVNDTLGNHEVENVYALGVQLGVTIPIPKLELFPAVERVDHLRNQLGLDGRQRNLFGIHISARKPTQRWPEGRFVELIRGLVAGGESQVLLFWAPGDETNPHHPGDDQKAQRILDAVGSTNVKACPTKELHELISGLACCDRVVCSDGGAMHIAAALGKPIVCFFGQSDAIRWHPWGVPHLVLQPESRDVRDLSVAQVREACDKLFRLNHAAA